MSLNGYKEHIISNRKPLKNQVHPEKRILLRMNREDIVYLAGLIEAYDGLAVLRTLNPYESIVELLTSPDSMKELNRLLKGLKKEFPLEMLS